MSDEWVVLDGKVMPLAAARIDPRDRGLVFGDGVYEVMRVVGGVALRVSAHLERLQRSLTEVGIPQPARVAEACEELLATAGLASGSLFLQVTRGVAPRSHLPARDLRPTLIILPASPPHPRPGESRLRAVTVPDWRWGRCDVKTTSLMGTVLGKLRARDAAVEEVLFAGPWGELREGGSTNLFVRREDHLETHPLDGRILPGVTRRFVLRAAEALGLPVVERAPRLEERQEWQEAFLCGTLTAVQPLVELDGVMIADRTAGDWTHRLATAYAEEEAALVEAARSGRAAEAPGRAPVS
jgi:D-alanine transaminase